MKDVNAGSGIFVSGVLEQLSATEEKMKADPNSLDRLWIGFCMAAGGAMWKSVGGKRAVWILELTIKTVKGLQ